MNNTINTTVTYNKLLSLERNFQELKLELFFTLPKKQIKTIYPEVNILNILKKTRNELWEERYAEKI